MEIYIVKQGDTVDRIAASYHIPAESVIYPNQLTYPYPLAIGQALLIVSGPADAEETRPPASAGGYVYPYVAPRVLQQPLPWLRDLFVFSYGFTPAGELIPPKTEDAFLISMAAESNTRPILTLTPIDESGMFNNLLIHDVLQDAARTEALIHSLTDTILARGFQGAGIDFEYILPQDRDAYVAFVRKTREAVHALGYEVFVALAPKTAADQPGLLYEGMDYAGLGEAADRVHLMTYEWGYIYGPPMAVAPLNQVRRVVEYAVSEIAPSRIELGLPNYGYDWPLPFVRGTTRATVISLQRAVELAIENDVPIEFDPVAMSPFFHYTKDDIEHEVWFEDVRSYREKFELVKEYGLHGVFYWQLMSFFRPNWILLEDTFQLEKGS